MSFRYHFFISLLLIRVATWAQSGPKLMVPSLHERMEYENAVNSVCFSPDGKLVLSAGSDGTAKLWSATSGLLLHNLRGHTKSIRSAEFSADGKWMITASEDNMARVWRMDSIKGMWNLKSSTGLEYAQFTPDGSYALTSAENSFGDYGIELWNMKADSGLKRFDGKFGRLSKDGKLIAACRGREGIVYDWLKLSYVILKGNSGYPTSIGFDDTGEKVVASSDDLTVKIWDSKSGELQKSLTCYFKPDLAGFVPGGKFIYAKTDHVLMMWKADTGEELYWRTDTTTIRAIDLASNGDMIALASSKQVKVLKVNTGETIWSRPTTEQATAISFNKLLDKLAIAFEDGTIEVWDTNNGKTMISLGKRYAMLNDIWVDNEKKVVWESSSEGLVSRDFNTGHLIRYYNHKPLFEGGNFFTLGVASAVINKSGTLAFAQVFGSSVAWDIATGNMKYIIDTDGRSDFEVSLDRSKIAFYSSLENSALVYYLENENEKKLFEIKQESIRQLKFSPDGSRLVTVSDDKSVIIWNAGNGAKEKTLRMLQEQNKVSFSPDSRFLLIYSLAASNDQGEWIDEGGVRIYEISSGKKVNDFDRDSLLYSNNIDFPARFSFDMKMMALALRDSIRVYQYPEKIIISKMEAGGLDDISELVFSPDAKFLLANFKNRESKIWDIRTGELVHEFYGIIEQADWHNGYLIIRDNSLVKYYDLNKKELKFSWVSLGAGDWLVRHSSGLFDAAQSTMDKLYFTQGMDVIEFNQLKDRYYEPGLWKKVVSGESLRSVIGFKSIDMPPEVQVGDVDEKGYLPVHLINKGGGIGEINVFVNGKEIIKDARDANVNINSTEITLKVFVGNHKSIVKGQENIIAVKAWNKDHWVVSRGKTVRFLSKENEQYKPSIHILACGVSDYAGDEIDLKFAAKDATDVSLALQLGAKKLFGFERSYVYNLTTNGMQDSFPTKANILKALEKISTTTHPLDVFVMYISGHGINFGGQDGDWFYLTQEAYTGSAGAYNDPAVRQQTTISSNELVELFKKVPALKQVLLIDACASGRVVDNLISEKDIESSTLRALDRMRDRTGMHIITGCTADAVSYEASKYGQGILTYSLLEGMRGAALRENQFVDVNKLFQYAQERVPGLAEGIGGIQTPQVFSPQGSQSFDIGLLTAEEQNKIPIARIRPVYVRSNFQDEDELEDILELGKEVDDALNESSAKGLDAPLIFVDVREYPDGCKITGSYRKQGDSISLKLKKRCGGEVKTFELKGKDVEALKVEILKII